MKYMWIVLFFIYVLFRINGIDHYIQDVENFDFNDKMLILYCSNGAIMQISQEYIEKLEIKR